LNVKKNEGRSGRESRFGCVCAGSSGTKERKKKGKERERVVFLRLKEKVIEIEKGGSGRDIGSRERPKGKRRKSDRKEA
jgi:hypothetical protein